MKRSFPVKSTENSGNELATATVKGLIKEASARDRWQPSGKGNEASGIKQRKCKGKHCSIFFFHLKKKNKLLMFITDNIPVSSET